MVATHEIGHLIGLMHTDEISSIMFPTYQVYNENFKISDYDVSLVKSLFQKENKSDQNASTNRFISGNSNVPYDRVELTTDQTQVDEEKEPLPTTSLTSTTTTNLPSSTRIYIIYKTNKFWDEKSNPINMLADSPCLMKFQAILKSKLQ